MRLRTFGGLWLENDDSPNGRLRPRPLALLAMLGAAGPKGASREHVVGVLWPESAPDLARHALSQTIYSLRRDLGDEIVLSTPNLALDPSRISSDAGDFLTAVRAENWSEAAALYVGPFLHGFYLVGASEFERWVETERASLAQTAVRAFEALVRECATDGRRGEAARHWLRLTQLDPVNTRYALSYMEALAATGDRTAALAHGKAYTELLRRDFEADVDPAVPRLMSRLRDIEASPMASDVAPTPPPILPLPTLAPSEHLVPAVTDGATIAVELAVASPRDRDVRRRRSIIAIGLVALGVAGTLGWRAATATHVDRPILAVGRIRDFTAPPPDVARFAGVTNEILATSLGRLGDLRVIAGSRMLELTPRGADTSRLAVIDAARRAGATELVEGELIPLADGQFRLDVRRVDIAGGFIRAAYQLSGRDRIALFDSVTTLITVDLGLRPPRGSLADVSTRSPVAFRFYEEGLRRYEQGDVVAARRLFRRAVHEDSTFAMALYYAWRTANSLHEPDDVALAMHALRVASRASERDRLLIQVRIGFAYDDPRAVVAADSLATRFPRDPEALLRAAEVIPDLARAISLANQAAALDSVAAVSGDALCRMCDALTVLTHRYEWADSSAAAERTLRRWISARPDDVPPWSELTDLLIGLGRRAEATAAWQRSESLGRPTGEAVEWNLVTSLRYDDFGAVDSLCATGLATPVMADFETRRWYCAIGLRMEGRYGEALALAREGRVPRTTIVRRDAAANDLIVAVVNLERGHPLAAADVFRARAITVANNGDPGSTRARNTAWYLTLAATGAVAGGDTLGARRLIDSIQAAGQQSGFARDPLLHHFVRGLLFSREHQDELAARELRASIASPTYGYSRANYELGRTLLALHRPAEAIPVVRAALKGGIEGPGLYVTRTELHELLAQLFDAVGRRDSAHVHYTVVEQAWRSTDPFLRPRYEAARRWLARAGITSHE